MGADDEMPLRLLSAVVESAVGRTPITESLKKAIKICTG